MKGIDIVKHIAEHLPRYTQYFSRQIAITSLTSVGNIATIVFNEVVELSVGSTISISGVNLSIDIISITREGNIVTVQTSEGHLLPPIDNRPRSVRKGQYSSTVTIEDATPTEYNGTWEVYTSLSEDTFTFKIQSQPISPAITNGKIIIKDFDNYNGVKEVVNVVDTVTYQYELQYENTLSIVGDKFLNCVNITNALSQTNIERGYANTEFQTAEPYLYVVLGEGTNYNKDGTPSSDINAVKSTNESYVQWYTKSVELYAIIPYNQDANNLFQGDIADEIHSVLTPAMHKILGRYTVDSSYKNKKYEGFTLVEDTAIEPLFRGSYCVYLWQFKAKVEITSDDVYSFDGGAPLKNVDIYFDSGIESKVEF